MVTRFRTSAKALTLAALSFPQIAAAQGFTGADVLGWGASGQDSYFQTSISMASIVAARTGNHEDIVTCINAWYGSQAAQQERHAYIRSKLEAFPAYHPQSIILAVIEEACGGLGPS